MKYIYSDEDNEPMMDDPFSGIHNPTIYSSWSEMRYYESHQDQRDREEREDEPASEDS